MQRSQVVVKVEEIMLQVVLLKLQPTSQTNCKARISVSLDSLRIWRINKLYLDSNHKPSPSKSRL